MDTETQKLSAVEYGEKEICDLLDFFAQNTYSVPNHTNEPRPYLSDVTKLMERDYILAKIENKDGKLCPQYPETILIPESPRSVTTIYENEDETEPNNLDVIETFNLIEKANLARCRQRFPVPVILINGKYVCRSSTLASEPEMCYRTGLINVPGYELLRSVKEFWWPIEGLGPVPEDHEDDPEGPGLYDNDVRAQTICDRARSLDIKLLKTLNVNAIVDIMVEKRKVKHSLYVSASEKVDSKRYSFFKLISLPYPGCEFFKDYHDAMFNAEGLKYKWDHPANDAVVSVPNDNIKKALSISWDQYKDWDLVLITQNYMKYILKYLQEENTGLLLHCISGWDRTPLFISLIRLSLWADYLVHPTLNEYEILYLTLAYDWYLFGHHLSNRLYKNEEIMAFCFDFLRYITSEDFSAKTIKKKHSEELKSDESRSPSRSSSSDEHHHKRKKLLTGEFDPLIEMDIAFDDNAPPVDSQMESSRGSSCASIVVLPFDDESMDTQSSDDTSKKAVLSPTSLGKRRTSPIPVAGRRARSESTGSNTSNISSNWQMISDCGSVEHEISYKPQRLQRLEKVRTIFNSCYQKTVKNESFGPPKKWMVEEYIGTISNWSHWFDSSLIAEEEGKNGNVENNDTEKDQTMETNGNGTVKNDNAVQNGSGDKAADNVNSNE